MTRDEFWINEETEYFLTQVCLLLQWFIVNETIIKLFLTDNQMTLLVLLFKFNNDINETLYSKMWLLFTWSLTQVNILKNSGQR